MGVQIGDIVNLKITYVATYALWGVVENQVGFVHCTQWHWRKILKRGTQPYAGQEFRVKVTHLTNCPYEQLSPDVTYEGTFAVDFGASHRRLYRSTDPWHNLATYSIGTIFTGIVEEVASYGCWIAHPNGADCRLMVDGIVLGLHVGQEIDVKILGIRREKKTLDVALVATTPSNPLLKPLTTNEKQLIGKCLRGATHSPLYEAPEFQALFGLTKTELAEITEVWSDGNEDTDLVDLAVNNSLVNLLAPPDGKESDLPAPSEHLEVLLQKWRKLHDHL